MKLQCELFNTTSYQYGTCFEIHQNDHLIGVGIIVNTINNASHTINTPKQPINKTENSSKNLTSSNITPTSSSQQKSRDFRGNSWGDSKNMVIALEKKENIWNDLPNIYAFKTMVATKNCIAIYSFTDDKLTLGKYLFTDEHSNENLYIIDYEKLYDLICKKYGNPFEGGKTPNWSNSLYKDDFESWGKAISYGHLYFYTLWETSDTIIYLELSGENYKIRLIQEYYSKKYDELRKKKELESNLNDI